MRQTTSVIGKDKYITRIHSSAGNDIVADEPFDAGGQNLGFAPGELLASALGACSCITMRMYADRKEWPLETVSIIVTYERDKDTRTSHFKKEVTMTGDLDEDMTKRLLQIADKCPIHFTLSNPITIETVLK
ncbi:MAG: OsmC family protein [Chitinophagaceae bacterium]|nr:OsmC family protein [Chitinophagaceae bacterium]MCB9045978.1 OsmC family protein [Chitinophagales bacterium]